MFKYKIFYIISAIIVVFASYLFVTDFSFVKRLVGYNVPPLETPSLQISPEIKSEFGFLSIPSGFSVSAFSKDLKGPRVIEFDPNGVMLVSETGAGRVVALEDKDKDGRADNKKVILSGLNKPHGMVFKCNFTSCILFVAETDKITAYDYNKNVLEASNPRKIADLPSGGGHFTRTIVLLSDAELLVSVGSSCNVCNESDSRRAKILKVNISTGQTEEFASGLRNSVFMAKSSDGQIWATEMGRDNLGDNIPPDEVNIIEPSNNYGWPICYGNKIHDSQFDKSQYIRDPCADTKMPVFEIPAHSAPLGLTFISDKKWPSDWQGNLLVAYHGSWNRSVPTGYKVVRLEIGKNSIRAEDFITGWLGKDKISGRPVDLKFGPDGALYISDDSAGIIYRVVPR